MIHRSSLPIIMIENTHQESNIYNKFTFSWLNPFIWKGWKGGAITREDLLHAKVEHRSSQTASRFSQKWKVHRDAQTEEERASQSAGALYKTIYEFLPGSLVSSAFLELLRVFTYQAPPRPPLRPRVIDAEAFEGGIY